MGDLIALSEPAILASLIAAIVSTVGIATVWRFHDWVSRYDAIFSGFAAGILLTAALVHVIPESWELSHDAALYVLIGFTALFVLNKVAGHHHPEEGRLTSVAAIAPFIAIAFHSFVDGLVYATAFSVELMVGLTAASGLIIHEFSEGIVLFLLIRGTGSSAARAFVLAFLGAAVTTPIGALIGVYAIEGMSPENLGILLGLSGGALLFVSTIHLADRFVRGHSPWPVVTFVAGIALTYLAIGGHGHVH